MNPPQMCKITIMILELATPLIKKVGLSSHPVREIIKDVWTGSDQQEGGLRKSGKFSAKPH